MFPKCLAALLLLSIAGCLSDGPVEPVGDPLLNATEPVPPVRTFTLDVNLTTYGSGYAAGTYFHPTPPAPAEQENYNCIGVETSGSEILGVNATARWDHQGELVLFHWMKDYQQPPRNYNQTIGSSPLHYEVHYPTQDGATWTFVGVAPAEDAPAGFELENTTVSLHVELIYQGEREPNLEADAYQGCSPKAG